MKAKINLSGTWNFRLDSKKEGIKNKFFLDDLEDLIYLPGTTAQQKKGSAVDVRETGHLTERYHFEGYAWYSRTFHIPEEYADGMFFLNLERTRKSYVWVDGRYVGAKESFSTAHRYDLTGFVKEGNHKLTVLVSNTEYKTNGGHMTSPDTQTNWNGILGDISLYVYHKVRIADLQIYPHSADGYMEAAFKIFYQGGDSSEEPVKVQLSAQCCRMQEKETADSKKMLWEEEANLHEGGNDIRIRLQFPSGSAPAPWNEYTPNLYHVSVMVKAGEIWDECSAVTGFRDLRTDERDFYLNDLPIMLRGKHDGMVYPLTGYAPMEKEAWRQTFQTARDYGINHYRFHTCCPPEAAFQAADELGIYLEPELPFWGTVAEKDEQGYNAGEREFLFQEGLEILREYGNHPSFLLFSMGNELWGSSGAINEIVGKYKEADARRWYVQGSNNFQFTPVILSNDDFFCGVRFSKNRLIRGSYAMCDAPLGHVQTMEPENAYCYDENIRPAVIGKEEESGNDTIQIQYQTGTKTVRAGKVQELIPHIPVVSHEIGQYEMYPDFQEIEKYTGVLQPENLKIFQKRLEDKGLLFMAEHFFHASGKFAVQCYKRELETAFRSKELAGFQILDLQDFPGQGTALVGILNAFMENKGVAAAKEWRQFCSDQVIMLSFNGHIYQAGQAFAYQVLFSNMNPDPIQDAVVCVSLSDGNGKVIDILKEPAGMLGQCRIRNLSCGCMRLPDCDMPQILTAKVEIAGTDICNGYELYVYPEIGEKKSSTVVVTNDEEQMKEALTAGKKVLFFGEKIREEKSVPGTYCTDFWCYSMFASISESMGKEKPVGTMGLYIESKHPALGEFPAADYSTPQWWKIITGKPMAILDDTDISPIVWMIDNCERNHKLGFIYEASVGNGKLLVCQADLTGKDSPEEKWLLHSLLSYAESDRFSPEQKLTFEQLYQIYN